MFDGSIVETISYCDFIFGLADISDICFSNGYIWAMNDDFPTFAEIAPDPNQAPALTEYNFAFDPNRNVFDDFGRYYGMVKHDDLIYFIERVKIRDENGAEVDRKHRIHTARIEQADDSRDVDNFAWAKCVASTINADDELEIGLAIDGAANLYVTGWFDGTNNLGGISLTSEGSGGQDIFVAKYNSHGELQWARRAGGDIPNRPDRITEGRDNGRGIGVDDSGNVYVAGGFFGTADFDGFTLFGSTTESFFLGKYDSSGTVEWVQQSKGGRDFGVYATGLAVDGAGNCYAVGFADNGAAVAFGTTNVMSQYSTGYSTFLVKYDTKGNALWAQLLESSRSCYCTAVSLDKDGNVFVGGSFRATLRIQTTEYAGEKDGFLASFNSDGVLQWAQQITGTGSTIKGICARVPGSVYAVGGIGNTACFSPSVCLTNIGDVIPGGGIGNGFLTKYDALSGAVVWAVQAGGTDYDVFTGVSAHPDGNIYVAGAFDGIGVLPGGFQAVVAAYDTNGIQQWTQSSTGTNGALSFSGPVVDAAGNCYVAGWYQGQATFGSIVLEPAGTWNYFLARLSGPANADGNGTIPGGWDRMSEFLAQ